FSSSFVSASSSPRSELHGLSIIVCTFKMKNASKQLMAEKARSGVTGYDTKSLKLTFTHFTPRLIATAEAWFANDVFFYGNKLFQSQFIAVISPNNHSVM